MANSNDIKQKIVLDGEKEYNRALSDAKRNLRLLKSELKAETAELGANATAQQKNEVRINSLKKQIKEQEKVVRTYQEALKEVKTKYADNEEAIAKWEMKLNDARTALANMKNDLDGVGKNLQSVQGSADMAAVATKSVADSFGSLSEIGGAISDSIESVFTGLIDTLKGTLAEIWGMIADTAAKANNWTDLASYYGTTAGEIERMNKAIEWSQGNFGDFTALLNQLAWGGKGKKITEWFGISDVNYDNKLDYAWDVLQKMQELSKTDAGKLGDAMEDIFGAKKSQQIMWFVSNLDTIKANLESYDENGYGMGDDTLKVMNDVWLKLGEIEGKWEDLKQRFAAGFGTVTLDIMTNVTGILDALSDYFNAETPEEREEALKKIETNITEMFETAKKAITTGVEMISQLAEELKMSDNPTVKALGELMGGLAKALEWFTEDNMNNVVKALEILAAFWIAGKGVQLATTISELAGNIATIKLFKGFNLGVGTGGVISTGATLTTDAVSAAIAGSGGTLASTFVSALTSTAGLIGVSVMTLGPVVQRVLKMINGNKQDEEAQKVNDIILGAVTPKERVEFAASSEGKEAAQTMAHALWDIVTGKDTEIPAKKAADQITEAEEKLEKVILDAQNGVPNVSARTPGGIVWGMEVTEQQRQAAEMFWDAWKNGDTGDMFDTAWDLLQQSFEGQEDKFNKLSDLMDQLMAYYQANGIDPGTVEDLPGVWWRTQGGNAGNTDGLTATDAQSIVSAINQMPTNVSRGVSNLRVLLDGVTVGRILTPYVSQEIARSINP